VAESTPPDIAASTLRVMLPGDPGARVQDGLMDALFGEPRLAAIYDHMVGGERRGDLDHYLAMAAGLGARSLLDVGLRHGHPRLPGGRPGHGRHRGGSRGGVARLARAKPGAERVRWLHGDATGLPDLQVDLATMTANVAHVFLTDEDLVRDAARCPRRAPPQAGTWCWRSGTRRARRG